ncbi:MAG: hypothetical protein ACJ8AD_08895 [Gemmatimonadaceae bacterium]
MAIADKRLTLELESLEAGVWIALLGGLPAGVRSRLGLEMIQEGSVTFFVTPGSDVATMNRVFGLGLTLSLTPRRLDRVVERYARAGVKRWMLQWTPAAAPRSAHEMLLAAGGRSATPMLKLRAGTRQLRTVTQPSTLRVVEIGADEAPTFQSTVAIPLGVDPELAPFVPSTIGHANWHHYLVLDGTRPIAGAAMYIHGDIAWFGLGATSSADRGRGAQTALLARRGIDAAKLGCTWVCAETPPDTAERPNPSYRNMLRAGMEVCYTRAHYAFRSNAEE